MLWAQSTTKDSIRANQNRIKNQQFNKWVCEYKNNLTYKCVSACMFVCGSLHCMNVTVTLLNLNLFQLSYLANCNSLSYLLTHCKNGMSPKQIPVHILMSVVNKYPCKTFLYINATKKTHCFYCTYKQHASSCCTSHQACKVHKLCQRYIL